MIGAVCTPHRQAQYLRAARAQPGLAARLASQLLLFGQKPGSGWRFFAGGRGGPAALMARGASAVGTGPFDGEELGLLLKFLGVQTYLCPPGPVPAGYRLGAEYPLYTLPEERAVPPTEREAPSLPSDLAFEPAPPPLQVARLVWGEGEGAQEEVQNNFYSDLCTAQNHGLARVVGARRGQTLVATVGTYGLWEGFAYLAAAQTVPSQRRRGIGGALLLYLAGQVAAEGRQPYFWCEPALCAHYERLGFIQSGKLSEFIQKSG